MGFVGGRHFKKQLKVFVDTRISTGHPGKSNDEIIVD